MVYALVETFDGSKHFNVAAGSSNKVYNDTSAIIIIGDCRCDAVGKSTRDKNTKLIAHTDGRTLRPPEEDLMRVD